MLRRVSTPSGVLATYGIKAMGLLSWVERDNTRDNIIIFIFLEMSNFYAFDATTRLFPRAQYTVTTT